MGGIFPEETCAICMDADPAILFRPCNHLCCCLDCSIKVTRCPMCRKGIGARQFANGEVLEHGFWKKLARNEKLTEYSMAAYWRFIDWDLACNYQTMSEEFMEHFARHLNWTTVSHKQAMSEEFMMRHHNKLHWKGIHSNRKIKITPEFRKWYLKRHRELA